MFPHPVIIFQDDSAKDLWPFSALRPVYELFIGTGTLLSKIEPLGLHIAGVVVPEYMAAHVHARHPKWAVNPSALNEPVLFINARWILSAQHKEWVKRIDVHQNTVWMFHNQVVAAFVQPSEVNTTLAFLNALPDHPKLVDHFKGFCTVQTCSQERLLSYAWDFMALHMQVLEQELSDPYHMSQHGVIKGTVGPLSSIINLPHVTVGKGTIIEDFALLNAQHGPIYISENCVIEAGSRLEGPLFIGPNTKILGGKISRSSLGPWCKIAGEVSESIFMGYANKGHYGYVGNSAVGLWVNFGAGTTTSNLKNTYDPVAVQVGDKKIQTGLQFLGSLIGDHTKFAIGTLLNTGSLIGCGSQLFGEGLHQKYIPDFSWEESKKRSRYQLHKWLKTAASVMGRRHVELSPVEQDLISYYYQNHANQ
jgi:UDP-N-acetylglucosamine diphosphorylase/glucosamine-1-phosphate N-acetyltransferase